VFLIEILAFVSMSLLIMNFY